MRTTATYVAGNIYDIEVIVERGECSTGINPATPTVRAIGPSGEDGPSTGELWEVKNFDERSLLLVLRISFMEAGLHHVALDFGDSRPRSFAEYVAQPQVAERLLERIDGAGCESVRRNVFATTACVASRDDEDAGRRRRHGVLIRSGQIVRRFEDDTLLHTAPHVFWKTDLDGGIERYADLGDGRIVRQPDELLSLPGETVALYADDERAWIVRPNALHLVGFSDAGVALRVEASLAFDAGFVVAPRSVAFAKGAVVYVVNNATPYVTRTCGFRLQSNTLEEIAGSCRQTGAIAAASHDLLWMSTWSGLQVSQVIGDELREVYALVTPYSWANQSIHVPEYPETGTPALFPRWTDGGLVVDAFGDYKFDKGSNDFMRALAANADFVWYSSTRYSANRLELFARPKP